jgi:hypothetical protein
VRKEAAPNEHVRELLQAYTDIQAQAASLPSIVWAPLSVRGFAARLRIPLFSGLIRYLLPYRIKRNIFALRRRRHAVAALDLDAPTAARDITVLDHYVESLPGVPVRRITVLFVLAVLLLAWILAAGVFRSEHDAQGLARAMQGVLTLDPRDVEHSLRSFRLGEVLGALFILAASFVLVAAPLASSFRLQRILLNLYPQGSRRIGKEPLANHAVRSGGAYVIERRAFSATGDRPPSELQIDLVVRAVALLIPVWIGLVLGVLASIVSSTEARIALGVGAALVVLLAVDGFLATWRVAKLRDLAPNVIDVTAADGVNRLSSVARRTMIAIAGIAVLAGGVLAGSGGDTYPDRVFVKAQNIAVTRATYGAFLTLQNLSQTGVARDERARRGAIVKYTIQISAPPGSSVRAVASLFRRVRDGSVKLASRYDSVLVVDQLTTAASTRSIDFRELALAHFGHLRNRPKGVKFDQGVGQNWLPLPVTTGQFFVDLSIFRTKRPSELPLDEVRSKWFTF